MKTVDSPREERMASALQALLEAARKIVPSQEQREQQRRSFAYGNTAFENDLITREMVDKQAERMSESTRDEP